MSERSFHPPPGQNTDTEEQNHVETSMSGMDYPPPSQHTITDFPAKQDRVELMPRAQQYIPPGQQPTVPPMRQQQYVANGQAMPQQQQYYQPQQQQQQQYVVNGQAMPQQQQYYQPQQQQQQQYVINGQAMPQQQQYYQPQQQKQQQYMANGQAMPQQQQYYQPQQQQQQQQQMPQYYQQQQQQQEQQQYSGSAQPTQSAMGSPAPFLNTPLQPWSTELFDCAHDIENAVITAFFPCITFGQIAEITDQGMSTCTGAGLIYGLLLYFTGLHWVYSWIFRTRMRAQYSLPEDPCHDCLVSAFCDACALCQEYRELQNRGFNMQLGWVGNMQLQAQKEAAAGVAPPVQGMTR